jgi:hypothetical protein
MRVSLTVDEMALYLRRTAEQHPTVGWPVTNDDLVVLHGKDGPVVGRIMRLDGGPQHDRWSWSITKLYVPPGTMTLYGTEETRDAAMAAFGERFRECLARAGIAELE